MFHGNPWPPIRFHRLPLFFFNDDVSNFVAPFFYCESPQNMVGQTNKRHLHRRSAIPLGTAYSVCHTLYHFTHIGPSFAFTVKLGEDP